MLFVAAVDVAVVFAVVVRDDEAAGAVVLFVAGGTAAKVEPVLLVLPVAGVVVVAGVVTGSVVIGVGTGGNGFESTLAISSFSPASDLLWRNL